MPKLKLLILDAGVVIRLHELGIWEQVRDRCDVHLSRIVATKEVLFQPGDEGEYGEDIREKYTQDGQTDMIRGRGKKN